MHAEILQRTKSCRTSLDLAKKKLIDLESKDVEHARDVLKNAEQRKKDFEDGKAKVFHKLESPEDAVALVQEAEKALKEVTDHIDSEKEKIKALKKRSKMNRPSKEEDALKDLRKKYCYKLYEQVYRFGRERAKQRGWRRPWDGPDGEGEKTRGEEQSDELHLGGCSI